MRFAVLAAGLVVCLAVAAPASAAAPNYIVVHGSGLPRPVVLDNWTENHRVLLELLDARTAPPSVVKQLGSRRLGLALYWGWLGKPRPTGPANANQRGWFYPAFGSRPAVIKLGVNGLDAERIAPTSVLKMFARHGVPVRFAKPS